MSNEKSSLNPILISLSILTVAVLCPGGRVLDPGLDLRDPGVHPGVVREGAASGEADHTYLGVPVIQA